MDYKKKFEAGTARFDEEKKYPTIDEVMLVTREAKGEAGMNNFNLASIASYHLSAPESHPLEPVMSWHSHHQYSSTKQAA
jgi:hypothetical protein